MGIIGCGWLGKKIGLFLQNDFEIFATTTTNENELKSLGFNTTIVNFDQENQIEEKWSILSQLDVLIIALPFSKKINERQLHRRLINLKHFIAGYNKQCILMSSIGIYPEKDFVFTENNCLTDNLNKTLLLVENQIKINVSKLNILRLGGLMGADRYLSKYTTKENYLAVNHIHFEDICNIVKLLLKKNIQDEIFNLVAPFHPCKQDIINFQTNQTISCETKKIKIVSSKKLIHQLNYKFIHPNPVFFPFKRD